MSLNVSISSGEKVAGLLGFNLQPKTLGEELLCVIFQIQPSPNLRKNKGPISTAATAGLALVPGVAEVVELYGKRMDQTSCSEQARGVKEARNIFYSTVPVVVMAAGALSLSHEDSIATQYVCKTMAALGVMMATWSGKRLYEASLSLGATIDLLPRY